MVLSRGWSSSAREGFLTHPSSSHPHFHHCHPLWSPPPWWDRARHQPRAACMGLGRTRGRPQHWQQVRLSSLFLVREPWGFF